MAQSHGGKCLSQTYVGGNGKMRFRCANGHRFALRTYHLRNGVWCWECAKLRIGDARRKYTLADCRQAARLHNGTCVSQRFTSCLKHMVWRCHNGHQWSAKLHNVLHGHWCPRCSHQRSKQEQELFACVAKRFPSAQHNVRGLLANRRFELDIYVPELNKAVEYDGAYWHNLDQAKERDRRKSRECRVAGVALLRVNHRDYLADRRGVLRRVLQFFSD